MIDYDVPEPESYFRDIVYLAYWRGRDDSIYYEPGSARSYSRMRDRARIIEGKTAVVYVYPLYVNLTLADRLTVPEAKRLAIAHMTGVGRHSASLRD